MTRPENRRPYPFASLIVTESGRLRSQTGERVESADSVVQYRVEGFHQAHVSLTYADFRHRSFTTASSNCQ